MSPYTVEFFYHGRKVLTSASESLTSRDAAISLARALMGKKNSLSAQVLDGDTVVAIVTHSGIELFDPIKEDHTNCKDSISQG